MAEVEAEIIAGSSSSSSALDPFEGKRKSVLPLKQSVNLMGELAVLKERIGSVDIDGMRKDRVGSEEWRGRLQQLWSPVSGPPTHPKHPEMFSEEDEPTLPWTLGAGTGLSELDKRLTQLEELIGPPPSTPDDVRLSSIHLSRQIRRIKLNIQVSSPLVPTLGKLDHLLTLLTQPRHLDAITRRVKLLLVDLDRVAAASRSRLPTSQPEKGSNVTLSQAEYTELQTLFSLLPRLDPLLPILPPLLARLKSLSGLHAEASEVAEGLRRLQADDRRAVEEKGDLEAVVKRVQEGLMDAAKGIERNWEGLEVRMRGLEGRIAALNG